VSTFLASCAAPPPGAAPKPCRDVIGPSLLRPFLAAMFCLAIVALVVWLARRGREPLTRRRRVALLVMAVIAAAATTTAVWASTHEFYSTETSENCSAFSASADKTCLREAQDKARPAFIGGAVALGGLFMVAAGPRWAGNRSRRTERKE